MPTIVDDVTVIVETLDADPKIPTLVELVTVAVSDGPELLADPKMPTLVEPKEVTAMVDGVEVAEPNDEALTENANHTAERNIAVVQAGYLDVAATVYRYRSCSTTSTKDAHVGRVGDCGSERWTTARG